MAWRSVQRASYVLRPPVGCPRQARGSGSPCYQLSTLSAVAPGAGPPGDMRLLSALGQAAIQRALNHLSGSSHPCRALRYDRDTLGRSLLARGAMAARPWMSTPQRPPGGGRLRRIVAVRTQAAHVTHRLHGHPVPPIASAVTRPRSNSASRYPTRSRIPLSGGRTFTHLPRRGAGARCPRLRTLRVTTTTQSMIFPSGGEASASPTS